MRFAALVILLVTIAGCIGSSEPRNPMKCHCAYVHSSIADIDTMTEPKVEQPEPEQPKPQLSEPI
jgi:hypothetical protein